MTSSRIVLHKSAKGASRNYVTQKLHIFHPFLPLRNAISVRHGSKIHWNVASRNAHLLPLPPFRALRNFWTTPKWLKQLRNRIRSQHTPSSSSSAVAYYSNLNFSNRPSKQRHARGVSISDCPSAAASATDSNSEPPKSGLLKRGAPACSHMLTSHLWPIHENMSTR